MTILRHHQLLAPACLSAASGKDRRVQLVVATHHSRGERGRERGIRPPERQRAPRALSLAEREEISKGLVAGRSFRSIAAELGRAPSTISREVALGGGRTGYRATGSDQAAWDRTLRHKPCKLARHPRLRRTVSAKLRRNWSPEQIVGWLKRSAY